MNYLESLYCYFYDARIKEGYAPSSDPTTGNMVLTVCFISLTFGSFYLLFLIVPGLEETAEDFLRSIFGRSSGKFIGRLLAFLLAALIFPLIKYTIGTRENYLKLIARFKDFPEEEQAEIAKKGLRFFVFSIAFLIVPILLNIIGLFS